MQEIFLSVIIPCFNEEKRFLEGFKKIKSYLDSLNLNYEIIAVNDGSKDDTLKIIQEISKKDSSLKVSSYERNKGKGGAVQAGFLMATGVYICFIDADMACSFNAIKNSIDILQANQDVSIVISNRRMNGSVEEVVLFRKIFSFFCEIVVFLITGLTYSDTQSGFKMFRNQTAKTLANKQRILGFSFDVEYLYIAKLNKIKVKQIPVIYVNDVNNSSVKVMRDSFRFFKDCIKIRRNRKIYEN